MNAPTAGIVINDEWKAALKTLHTAPVVLVTGDAGTGKSTMLRLFREELHAQALKVAIVAPTGVAALNVGAETIHSLFGINIHTGRAGNKNSDLLEALDVLIIDEISMVNAETVDEIDKALKRARQNNEPFGGCRVVMFGDPYQLPPVVNDKDPKTKRMQEVYGVPIPYFFDAFAFNAVKIARVNLTTVYRQNDPLFIALLNKIRSGNVSNADLAPLNARVNFTPPAPDKLLTLTARNADADRRNEQGLGALKTKAYLSEGTITGEMKADAKLPAPLQLVLKVGMRAMTTVNQGDYRNGSLGTITAVEPSESAGEYPVVTMLLDNGISCIVSAFEWEQVKQEYDPEKKTIGTVVIGEYKQLPLVPAYGITIHKSQGLSLDNYCIDLGTGAFSTGQTYVAVSRATTLGGLYLSRAVNVRDVRTDPRVIAFMSRG